METNTINGDIRATLEKQLQVLHERSRSKDCSTDDLYRMTMAMAEIVEKLTEMDEIAMKYGAWY